MGCHNATVESDNTQRESNGECVYCKQNGINLCKIYNMLTEGTLSPHKGNYKL
uniref:Uncharacterized protein n=1 Tax=Arion vulgaris TaxID=1028688 RepID=A0A0B6ZYB0_9EUPU